MPLRARSVKRGPRGTVREEYCGRNLHAPLVRVQRAHIRGTKQTPGVDNALLMELPPLADRNTPVLWLPFLKLPYGDRVEAVIHCWVIRPYGQRGQDQAHRHGACPLPRRCGPDPDWRAQCQTYPSIRGESNKYLALQSRYFNTCPPTFDQVRSSGTTGHGSWSGGTERWLPGCTTYRSLTGGRSQTF